jgi:hypothetical protein
MRINLANKIARLKSRMPLITEQSTTLNRKKSTEIVWIQICFVDSRMTFAVNLFLDLIESQSVTTKGIL